MSPFRRFESPFGAASPDPGDRRPAGARPDTSPPDDESELHRRETAELIEVLDLFLIDDPGAHAGGGTSFYYEKGNPAARVVPDVYVVRAGAFERDRGHVKLWEEPVAPAVVIEVVSAATRDFDQGFKKDLYARLGVEECFLYDPLGDCLEPPLSGFRLEGCGYRPIPRREGSLASGLGVAFEVADGHLRIVDLATGQTLAGVDETFEELERLRSDVMRMFG